jgi:hypothetical protein
VRNAILYILLDAAKSLYIIFTPPGKPMPLKREITELWKIYGNTRSMYPDWYCCIKRKENVWAPAPMPIPIIFT